MKEYKVKRYGRDRRHQKTAATLKTVLMVLLIAGACAAGWFLYDPISAWLTEKAEERQQRQEQQRQEEQRQQEQNNGEDGEPGTVCEVLLKGYQMEGTVLRHAMVKVVPE